MEDRQILAKSIAEQLGISCEWVGSIIHEDLDMRKLSVKLVPKCLNADQKRQWCHLSEQLLEFFRCDPNDFLSGMVAMDETWLYHYEPETKKQSMEWRRSSSTHPKKFRVQKFAGKVLASIFWNQDGILLIDYLGKGQTMNLFLHDNAPAHWPLSTQKKLVYLGFMCLDHPPSSLDLAPLDCHLFSELKKQLKGHHFSSDVEVIAATETWLDGQPYEFFLSGLQKLELWAKKYMELRG